MVIPNHVRVVAVISALVLAGGLLTLALLAKPSQAQAQTERSNEWVPIDGVIDNPCTGELVSYQGTVHVVSTITQDEGGNLHFQGHTNLVGGEGVGLTSGAEYVVRERSSFHSNRHDFESDQAPANFTQVYTLQFTREGSPTAEDDFLVNTFIQFTQNANGEVTAVVDKFEEVCT
jgi:hypothetical protein